MNSEFELHRMEWQHPRLGRISESVCPTHETEVLIALKVLGIGSVGSVEPEKDYCDRCRHPRRRARAWLGEAAEARRTDRPEEAS